MSLDRVLFVLGSEIYLFAEHVENPLFQNFQPIRIILFTKGRPVLFIHSAPKLTRMFFRNNFCNKCRFAINSCQLPETTMSKKNYFLFKNRELQEGWKFLLQNSIKIPETIKTRKQVINNKTFSVSFRFLLTLYN